MGRSCTICNHKDHESINLALVGPESLRAIADRWFVKKTSLLRHKKDHLPDTVVKAAAAAEVVEGDNLLGRLQHLNQETSAILAEARTARDHNLALKALVRAEKQLELERRLFGELKTGSSVNLAESAEWAELRTAILLALEPFPDAKLAVAKAVMNVGA